ncbi:MAG: hypothetical protein KTR31_03710 [Myxococcales bacterium]|nr:hypothetical protein [Myxococcales bacterium]
MAREMPGVLRLFVLGIFAFVFLSVAVPICIGGPIAYWRISTITADLAPTEEDQRFAEEMEAAAEAAGRDLDISAQEIAHARRLGQLDEVEAMADEILEGRLRADEVARPPPEPKRMKGAFYRDQLQPEPEPPAWRLRDFGLAAGGAAMFLAACGMALAAFYVGMRPSGPVPEEAGESDGFVEPPPPPPF